MPEYEDFEHLKGSIQLEYKPAPKSRQWRKGPIRLVYSEFAYNDAVVLAAQEGWAT